MHIYPELIYPKYQALELKHFKEMDYYAVEHFNLPIELMMENAGLQLANLIAHSSTKDQQIRIGIGNGNNGEVFSYEDLVKSTTKVFF